MSKHTPGPWKARKNGEIGVIDTSDTQSYGMMLVVCRIDEWDFKDQYEANAKLIAAEPDLLEVAEYCRDLLMRYEINRVNGEEIAEEALKKLNAAIAKARGES